MTTITFQCYSCNQVLKVGADKAGRKAKCIKCGTILTIPVASAEDPPTPPPSSRNTALPGEAARKSSARTEVEAEPAEPRKRRRNEDEEDQDDRPRSRRPRADEEEDDRPRKRRRDEDDEDDDDRPRSRRRRDDDEEEDDDRPRKRRRDEDEEDEDDRPRSRRRRDDEDEEDDDRPRKRRRDEEEDEDDEDRPRKARARAEDDDEDEDRPRRSRDRDDDEDDRRRGRKSKKSNPWPKVRLGLLFNFISAIGLIAFSGLMLLTALLVLIGALATSEGLFKTGSVLFLIAMIVYVALEAPAIAGYVLALFTPNKKGALAMSITALCLGVLSLVLKIIFFLVPYFTEMKRVMAMVLGLVPWVQEAGGTAVVVILMILILAALGAELIVYPLYLRALSLQLKERYLEQDAYKSLFFACGAVGAQILVILITVIWSQSSGSMGGPAAGKAFLWIVTIMKMIAAAAMLVFGLVYMRYIQVLRSQVD